jgi:two-component system chemotaxis response regulator CheB
MGERDLSNQNKAQNDPVREIMEMVQAVSGVQLGSEKRLVVETRLIRRARQLRLGSVEEYLKYFRQNRETETTDLISLITTHTTEFFRESAHFDYLFNSVFPKLLREKASVRFWSAASSSGEELYSLAIAWLEFIRERKTSRVPKVEFIGTDIDELMIQGAREGTFGKQTVKGLEDVLVRRYFDVGTGELADLVRIKDEVHALCRFEQMNLLAAEYRVRDADVIMLRNVLIYFKSADVAQIAKKMESSVSPDGYLFLGHSESFLSIKSRFSAVGNSVYQLAVERKPVVAGPSEVVVALMRPIRVMIVDDSRPIRMMLKKILSPEQGFQVVAEAENPLVAEELLKSIKPDLMTLDIHMPEMDGITYLEKLQRTGHQFPVVMLSSVSYEEAVGAFRCFDLGAVDFIEKPKGAELAEDAERIRTVLKAANGAKRRVIVPSAAKSAAIQYKPSEDWQDLIMIGASTGGPEAIQRILPLFPDLAPPILIVQHIPAAFSKAFALRLNEVTKLKCREACDGDRLESSNVYVAPGGKQMRVVSSGRSLHVEITDEPPVNRHKPSVDYLFNSICRGKKRTLNVSAALLTGMGDDGARGLKALRDWGCHTIAQDEASSVVYGMPKAAAGLNAAAEVLSLLSIPHHLFRSIKKQRVA